MYKEYSSVQAAKNDTARKRKPVPFILGGKQNPICEACKRGIRDFSEIDANGKPKHPIGYKSNRCWYDPIVRKVKAYHYVCSWDVKLDTIK